MDRADANKPTFWVCDSLVYPGKVFYLFRGAGIEIVVQIVKTEIKSSRRLREDELSYFESEIIGKAFTIYNSKINRTRSAKKTKKNED